jgi:hypothetical protein
MENTITTSLSRQTPVVTDPFAAQFAHIMDTASPPDADDSNFYPKGLGPRPDNETLNTLIYML